MARGEGNWQPCALLPVCNCSRCSAVMTPLNANHSREIFPEPNLKESGCLQVVILICAQPSKAKATPEGGGGALDKESRPLCLAEQLLQVRDLRSATGWQELIRLATEMETSSEEASKSVAGRDMLLLRTCGFTACCCDLLSAFPNVDVAADSGSCGLL